MFSIITVSNFLEWIILMPASYTVMKFFLPPHVALLLSGLFCVIAFIASCLCTLSIKLYLYRIISISVGVTVAYLTAQISFAAVLLFVICTLVFTRVRLNVVGQRDIGAEFAAIGVLLNIPIALLNISIMANKYIAYSNATIFISTIASVILMILKQVDDSRRFGKNNMSISSTQKSNNKLYASIIIILLLVFASMGQVSNIYKMIIGIFKKFFEILGYLFAMQKAEKGPAPAPQPFDMVEEATGEPSLISIILETLFTVIAIIIIVAIIGYIIYLISKMIVKLIKRIIDWLNKTEQISLRVFENDHIDEKESLYNKNLKKLTKKISAKVIGLFDRDIPYNKLPDKKAKIRRLFRYFTIKAKNEGVSIVSSSTAQEICSRVTDISPETVEFNNLMSKNYNCVRYGDLEPSDSELKQLEKGLL